MSFCAGYDSSCRHRFVLFPGIEASRSTNEYRGFEGLFIYPCVVYLATSHVAAPPHLLIVAMDTSATFPRKFRHARESAHRVNTRKSRVLYVIIHDARRSRLCHFRSISHLYFGIVSKRECTKKTSRKKHSTRALFSECFRGDLAGFARRAKDTTPGNTLKHRIKCPSKHRVI